MGAPQARALARVPARWEEARAPAPHDRLAPHSRLRALDRGVPVFLDERAVLAGRQCKLDRSPSAGSQVFSVDPQGCALGLGRHLKHRHFAPKRIAATGRILTIAGWQLLDSEVLAEVVERLVVAPELAKHDRGVEKRIAAPHDAKAVDVRFE